MEKDKWNDRYSADEYVYSKNPNAFLKETIDKLNPGRILFIGEGEGRNAVYAAKKGWNAFAIDFSEQGREKALKLAGENNVTIDYTVTPVEDYAFPENEFDAVVIIFFHVNESVRKKMFSSVISSLKKGGRVIIEVFSKAQLANNSGGPKEIDLLYTAEEFRKHFSGMNIELLTEESYILKEGPFHDGKADVIRVIAQINF